jgi:hypothetical protein
MKGKCCRCRGQRAKPRKIVARNWDQSAFDTSHPYKLIGAQFQTLFMLLREEIRHDHAGSCWLTASSGTNQVQSRWLALAHGELRRAQASSATAQAAYSLLTLHPCVTQDQIRKKLCVTVDFT